MKKYCQMKQLQLPVAVKNMNSEQMASLCGEIRQRLIRTVSRNGGHLASNLGVVELTVALHKVFDFPQDQIVWDVGHQCYTHKMLTGRLEYFPTLRKTGGISGFPKPSESPCDAFLAGHASTSLSAACGLAKAKTLASDPHTVIAVVGDGALTGGMIYEALNHAGRGNDRLIMILNDNAMSISKSVGSFARYLAKKRTSNGYLQIKDRVEETLLKIPLVGYNVRDVLVSFKAAFRQMIYHSNLFEDFGFDYLGPIDGHNLSALIQVLTHARELQKPVVVHVNTIKGKGYLLAERDPARYHGVSAFDQTRGIVGTAQDTFSSVFGELLVRMAEKDRKLCAITAAMEDGTGLSTFAKRFLPENRFFDVGIAEEHAITFACGLSAGGFIPVAAIYSTFLQRAYDQIIHDGSIEQQHVVLAVDRAGFIGDDGATHQGLFDAAFLSHIPGMTVYSPTTFAQLSYALHQAIYHVPHMVAVRYPRGGEPAIRLKLTGNWTHWNNSGKVLFVTYGRQSMEAECAIVLLQEQGYFVDLLVMNKIVPIPEECLKLSCSFDGIFFLEEGILQGGIGEHFISQLLQRDYHGRAYIQGVDNPFLPQMTLQEARKRCGLDAFAIAEKAREKFFESGEKP